MVAPVFWHGRDSHGAIVGSNFPEWALAGWCFYKDREGVSSGNHVFDPKSPILLYLKRILTGIGIVDDFLIDTLLVFIRSPVSLIPVRLLAFGHPFEATGPDFFRSGGTKTPQPCAEIYGFVIVFRRHKPPGHGSPSTSQSHCLCLACLDLNGCPACVSITLSVTNEVSHLIPTRGHLVKHEAPKSITQCFEFKAFLAIQPGNIRPL